MNKLVAALFLLTICSSLLATQTSQISNGKILGLQLNMNKEEAKKRLQEIGTFVRSERKRQEIWEVRDESFSHVIVGFQNDDKLRFITAVAREDKEAKRVAYSKAGNLKTARQAGDPKIKNFNYEWEVPAQHERPRMLISARGRDTKFLTTYTLKRLGN